MNQPVMPDFLLKRQSQDITKQLADSLGTGAPPYLSILGGRFTLIDAAGNEQPIGGYDQQLGVYVDVTIIDVNPNTSKVFYNTPFDPNGGQWLPPVCFSDNGMAPSRNASQPQSPTCAACPNNVWGSAISKISGRGVKACSDQKKIALVVEGFEPIFLLRVPPNTLKKLGEYVHQFQGQQFGISDVITRISFVQGVVGTLQFQAVNWINAGIFEKREKALLTHSTDQLIGRNDVPHPAAAALPMNQPVPQLAAPVNQPPAGAFQPNPLPGQPSPVPSAVTMPPQTTAAPSAAPVPAAEPAKPRGRPRRNTAAQQVGGETPMQAPPAAAAPAVQAPFRPTAPTAAPAAAPAPQNFGVTEGTAPNPQMATTLQSLFGQPQR